MSEKRIDPKATTHDRQPDEERSHQGSAWLDSDRPSAETPLDALPDALLGTPPAEAPPDADDSDTSAE
jgi:hypothetical protein